METAGSGEKEKKRLMSVSPIDRHRIRCWCEHLHRLSYPRLVNFAASLLSEPKSEVVRKFTKRQLCGLLARLPERFTDKELNELFHSNLGPPTDLKIQDDILHAIDTVSSDELTLLDRVNMPLSSADSKCQDAFNNITDSEKKHFYSLFNLYDPISFSLVTDFLRVPSQKTEKNPWLFNFETLKGLRRAHPLTKEPFSNLHVTGVHVDTKARDKAREAIREEWGYPFPVQMPEFTLEEKKRDELRQAWALPQSFIPTEPGEESEEEDEDADQKREVEFNRLRREIDAGVDDEKERKRRDDILRWIAGQETLPPSIHETVTPEAQAARGLMTRAFYQSITTQFGPLPPRVFNSMIYLVKLERGLVP